jgi:hypothetical protein
VNFGCLNNGVLFGVLVAHGFMGSALTLIWIGWLPSPPILGPLVFLSYVVRKISLIYLLAANSHFYTVLISCLHQCFTNLDFCRDLGIKQHYYSAHFHTCLCSCFHDCKCENFDFEVILKTSLDCYDHSCLYVHCVSNLLIVIQLARLQDSLLI